MKTGTHLGWRWSAFGLAAVMVVGLTVGAALRPARVAACCIGDCDSSGAVTVDELIVLVNIDLGSADTSTCTAIPPGTVDVALIIQAVNNALGVCVDSPGCVNDGGNKCGDGVVQPPETCDDGGTCTGGTNAGTHCTAESDCTGNGICDGGTKYFYTCADDSGCPGGKCIHCKTFGGDGCSANCTAETDITMTLLKGVVSGRDIQPGTSGAVVHSDILTIPLPLTGTQVVTIGEKGADGHVPAIVKAASIQFPRIPVSSIACACLRGVAAKTCGGTLYDIDGVTPSTDCTPGFTAGDSICPTDRPCSYVHGPGNAASGTLGCGADGYAPVDALYFLDSGGSSGVASNPIITLSGSGPIGSGLILNNNAIGTIAGVCSGSDPTKFGPDGEHCTDDDPQDTRGTPSPQVLVTGLGTGQIANANETDGDDLGGPFSITGTPVNCDNLLGPSHSISGGSLAGAFVSLKQPTTGDVIVTTALVGQ